MSLENFLRRISGGDRQLAWLVGGLTPVAALLLIFAGVSYFGK